MAFSLNNIPIDGIGKAKRKSFGIGSLLFLVLFGLVFIGISYLFIKDDIRANGWPTVEGKVTQVHTSRSSDGDTYSASYTYTVEGKTYTAKDGYSSSMRPSVGDSRTISYNPDNHSDGIAKTQGMGFFIYLFPLIGFIVIVGGIIGYISSRKRTSSINTLKTSGVKVQGVVTNIEYQQSSNSNRSSSSTRITVTAPSANGSMQSYTSDWISGNTMGLANYQQQPVAMDVYLDAANPENYYVDLDDLPSLDATKLADMIKQATGQTVTIPTQQPAKPPSDKPPIPPTPPATPLA